MSTNFEAKLNSLGLKDDFDKKAKEFFEKQKPESTDSSIFESQDAFVEYCSNEVFGDSMTDEANFDGFIQQSKDSGWIADDSEALLFQAVVDNNWDGKLQREETDEFFAAVYNSANSIASDGVEPVSTGKDKDDSNITPETENSNNKTNYKTVEVKAWGSGEDDCISRIVQKHVPDIKLYGDDYNQYVDEICKLNDIEDPNIIQTGSEIKLPPIKYNENGEIERTADGKLQFETLSENGENDNKASKLSYNGDGENVIQLSNNNYVRQIKDDAGNVIKEEFLGDNPENTVVKSVVEYEYDENNKKVKSEEKMNDGTVVATNYDSDGRKKSGTITRNGITADLSFEYKADGSYEESFEADGKSYKANYSADDFKEYESIENSDGSKVEYEYSKDGYYSRTLTNTDKSSEKDIKFADNSTAKEIRNANGVLIQDSVGPIRSSFNVMVYGKELEQRTYANGKTLFYNQDGSQYKQNESGIFSESQII